MKIPSVCYVLSYYSPKYIRTQTLIKALQNIDGLELYQAQNSLKGIVRYFETIWKLILVRVLHNPQCYILGFRGYEFFWIVRLITLGKFLIYDHMMSPYDSLINEQAIIRKGGWIDKLIFFYEKSILLAADLVLTDTNHHKQYFHELFELPLEKVKAIPVGTDENQFQPGVSAYLESITGHFHALFYGSFLPLHGMDIILKAALILRNKPIHFTLIGGNRLDLTDFHKMIGEFGLDNVTHIDWVEFEELPKYVARSDIGLGGPFGNTGQAGRVITGKTFQFLAMAKPVIIGSHNGDDGGFEDRVNCLLVPRGNEFALADAILWAFEHRNQIAQIGWRGYKLYQDHFSIKQITELMKGIIAYEI